MLTQRFSGKKAVRSGFNPRRGYRSSDDRRRGLVGPVEIFEVIGERGLLPEIGSFLGNGLVVDPAIGATSESIKPCQSKPSSLSRHHSLQESFLNSSLNWYRNSPTFPVTRAPWWREAPRLPWDPPFLFSKPLPSPHSNISPTDAAGPRTREVIRL